MSLSTDTGLRRLALVLVLPYTGFWAAVGIINYQSQDSFDQSLFWGAFLPAVIIAVGAATRWVYRGFHLA